MKENNAKMKKQPKALAKQRQSDENIRENKTK